MHESAIDFYTLVFLYTDFIANNLIDLLLMMIIHLQILFFLMYFLCVCE